MHRGHRWRLAIFIATIVITPVAIAWPAMAEPATTVAYPAWASATRYAGQAFDTCTAPPLATMQAWLASPYRAIGVYVGGVNRTCPQPELTADWVRAVASLGWRLIPVYKGLQAPCGGKPADAKITPSAAAAQGRSSADDASTQATGYSPPITRCLYPYQVTATNGANVRSGPGVSYPIRAVLPGGALAWLFCQQAGSTVGSTRIWDKIASGHWVSDNWVATPSATSYSKPAPRC
jgi:Rv2525c-like, glycoside hydrolase-like domain